ncbi:stabilizer of axonemal microtubules 2-like [Sardina pilchardus]|uniref:stabilizer of axonemal microtubules 2-like n=1 Tax=Sardina pilchardus TaxID=27697 RepID=UPI002E0F5A7A
MKTLCSCQICEICTCGQHDCLNPTPPTVLPACCSTDAVSHHTEYRDRFHHHGTIAKRNSRKILSEYKPLEGEISATTTFQSDYVAHPVKSRSPKPVKAYAAPAGPMLLKTTYMNDFRMCPTQKSTTSKVEQYNAPTTKMDTLSIYNDVYRAWTPQPRTSYKKVDNLKVNEGRLDMTTTSKADYCHKTEPSRRKSFKPEQKTQMESLPFEGKSVYSQMYVPHTVEVIPPKPRIPYKPSSAPFQAISTHRRDYKGDRSSAVRSCKVKATWEPRSTPFEGKSECQDRFQVWPNRPVTSVHKAAEYSPPEGDMELTSTAHMDFSGAPGRPATTARPRVKAWSKGEPFEARSATQDHYRAWEGAKKVKSLKPVATRPPLSAFEGTTTFRAEFTPKKTDVIASCKPVQTVLDSCAMEHDTIYRSTYKKHEVQPCPACHLPEGHVLSLGKNGYILCHNIPPEDHKAITRSSTADMVKYSRLTNTRRARSACLNRQNK